MSESSSLGHLSRGRYWLLATLSVVVGLGLALATAELVLRFLPGSTVLGTIAVSSEQPIFRFTPDREYAFSKSWNFQIANRGRVNNDGWVNDQDYVVASTPPLLAVIGDSYVEALMVPYAETIQGRLAAALRDRMRVYSFAASGAPLSQYAVWAQYAAKRWGASALIVNVVGNDFDESLAQYKQGPGFWHYAPDGDGRLALRLVPYQPGLARPIAQHSALVRYLLFNLEITTLPQRLKRLVSSGGGGPTEFAGNVSSQVEPERIDLSLRAIDAFLADLPRMTGLPPDRIAFTVDGFRYPEAAAPTSYFGTMREAFIGRARAAGFQAIDLDEAFFAEYARTGRRFEFPVDSHWSGEGHRVAAEAVQRSPAFANWDAAASGAAGRP